MKKRTYNLETLLLDYHSLFGTKIVYDEVLGNFEINDPKTGKWYEMPERDKKNASAFADRIERSKAAGRNLFFEEWPEARDVEAILKEHPDYLY